jgi:hypothetical protein
MRSKQILTIASDGGLKTHKGSYGWKIVTQMTPFSSLALDPWMATMQAKIAAPILILASLKQYWGGSAIANRHSSRYANSSTTRPRSDNNPTMSTFSASFRNHYRFSDAASKDNG